MARSKIKGTNGKPVAKTKKKSSNRASVTIKYNATGGDNMYIEKKNDNDPSMYYDGPGIKDKRIGKGEKYRNPVKTSSGKTDAPGAKTRRYGSTNSGPNVKAHRAVAHDARQRAKKSKLGKRGDGR